MTKAEFALSHHEIKLELELFRRSGRSFQDFFEQVMQKADPSFLDRFNVEIERQDSQGVEARRPRIHDPR